MRIALHDAEKERMPHKTFPNYALMKISAWHKLRGDVVEWYDWREKMPQPTYVNENQLTIEGITEKERHIKKVVEWALRLREYNNQFDKVYSSKVFDFTPVNDFLPLNTIFGGTGYGLYEPLSQEIDDMFPDYSIYPQCDYAIGFLTRGCIRNCEWCVVPKKEGKIRPYLTFEQIARPDTNKIVFMDNNVLACDYGVQQLKRLAESGYEVDFNQGLDIRLINPEIVKVLAKIKWIRFIRFSCDSYSQVEYFRKAMPLFREYKMASKIFVYLLVRNDVGEAEQRVRALHEINKSFSIYAQAERNIGKTVTEEQREFAERYIYGRSYKKENWQDYCRKRGFNFL